VSLRAPRREHTIVVSAVSGETWRIEGFRIGVRRFACVGTCLVDVVGSIAFVGIGCGVAGVAEVRVGVCAWVSVELFVHRDNLIDLINPRRIT